MAKLSGDTDDDWEVDDWQDDGLPAECDCSDASYDIPIGRYECRCCGRCWYAPAARAVKEGGGE